jgi:hypothetical protein
MHERPSFVSRNAYYDRFHSRYHSVILTSLARASCVACCVRACGIDENLAAVQTPAVCVEEGLKAWRVWRENAAMHETNDRRQSNDLSPPRDAVNASIQRVSVGVFVRLMATENDALKNLPDES